MFTSDYSLSLFTPGEAERITGVATALQRDWRRRQFLPYSDHHARFDVFSLAALAFAKAMSDRGIGPLSTKDIVGWAANGIAFHALRDAAAYEGDYIDARAHAPGVLRKLSPLGPDLSRAIPAQYLVLWADDSHEWATDLGVAFGLQHAPSKIEGPVVVVDQAALGARLLRRAGRPFVAIERRDL